MFPTNRARHDQDPDTPINHSICARSVRAGAAEHLSGDSPPRQPGRMPHRTLSRELLLRPGLLALAVVAVLGGIVVGPAAAISQDMGARQALLPPSPAAGSPQLPVLPTQAMQPGQPGEQPPYIPTGADVHLELAPADATIWPGDSKAYIATAIIQVGPNQPLAANNPDTSTESLDVTRWTDFTITGPGPGECPRDQLGKVSCTASEVGDYTVSAILSQKGHDDLRATATLRVTDPVVSLKLKPETAEIPVRTPQDYLAEGTTAAGRTVDVTDQVALSIDPGGRCPEARCTPAEVGDHRVTATLDQPGRDQLRATATLRVTDPVVSLKLKPETAEIPVRTPQDYLAEGTTAAGRTVDVTDQTGFTITAPGKCSQAPGKVSCTASQVGDYTVTGTLTQKGRDPITATATLTVVPGPPTKLKLAPPKAEIPAGAKQPYTAVTEDQFGNETDVTGQTDFRIDKGGSCDGASCSATKVDVYTVTATLKDPGLSATATLTVVPGPPKSLELAPPTKEIQAGVEQPYTAVTKDQHGNKTDVTAQTSLSINPPSSCAIAGTKVSCTKTGSYTVTGTLRDHRPPLSGTATLTAVPGPATTLRLDPGKAEIQAGVEQPYTAIGVDQHGNETDFTSQTGFTITAPGKCSQAPGKVSCTASEIGDYTVTATLDQL